MGAAAGALKEPGDKDFVAPKNYAAYRAYTGAVAPEAVKAAFNVHKTVFAPVKGRESR